MWPSYPAHGLLTGPARAKAETWRLLIGLICAATAYLAMTQFFYGLILGSMSPMAGAEFAQRLATGSTPSAMLVLLFSFGLMPVALAGVVVVFHRRSPITLLGPWPLFRGQLWVAVWAMVVLNAALMILPPWGMDEPLEPGLQVSTWVMLLPFSLVAVLVQTGSEEILFRGYIQQQLAARYRSPWIWMVMPSALFAAGHYTPETAGENALLIAAWAGIFGMVMADLTARSGTLGPAIAVHFVNNVMAILVTSVPDDLNGLALFQLPFSMADEAAMSAWLPVDFGLMLVSWLAVRLAIRR